MKQESIERYLAKRQAGTLSDSELDELNRLTRKDEVIARAERQAAVIVRRRRTTVAVIVAGLALTGAGLALLQPRQQTTLIARQQTITAPPAAIPVQAVQPVQAMEAATTAMRPTPEATAVRAGKPTPQTPATTVKSVAGKGTVVVCNNQCEADSVINDIWKFLKA